MVGVGPPLSHNPGCGQGLAVVLAGGLTWFGYICYIAGKRKRKKQGEGGYRLVFECRMAWPASGALAVAGVLMYHTVLG